MKKRNFELTKGDGKVIRGCVFLPEGDGPFDTVIFSHGFGSCYEELFHHGGGFAEAGIIAVFFDFCGGGPKTKSDGTMLEMTVLTEKEDLSAVYREVSSWDNVKKERIFLAGESQGGFVSAHLASEKPELFAGLILWYPAFNIPAECKKRLTQAKSDIFGFPVSGLYDKAGASVDIFSLLPKFKNPVLIIQGDKDNIVPLGIAQQAMALYPKGRLVTLAGEGHGFEGKMSLRAEALSVAFIKGNFLEVLAKG